MANDVGLRIQEGVANGLAPFTLPSKRNIGLLMERERGVENKPFRINSLADDQKRFGGFNSNMFGPVVVRNLFKNAKGAPVTYYGVRIVGTGSIAASTGVVPLNAVNHTYTAGQQGVADKGSWGNNLKVVFYSFNSKFRNKVGIEVYLSNALVEVFTGDTNADLQADINSNSGYITSNISANYTTPTWTPGVGTITTSTASNIVNAVTATPTLVTATPTAAAPLVAQVNTITVGATIVAGDTFPVTLGSTTVTYTAILADTPSSVAAGIHALILASVPFTSVVTPTVATNVVTLTANVVNTPFTQTSTAISVVPVFSTLLTPVGTQLRDALGNVIGTIASIVSPVQVTLENNASVTLAGASYEVYLRFTNTFTLAGGTYVAPVESDFYAITLPTNKGLALMNGVDIQLLSVTENHTLTMAQELKSYAEGRKDVFAVVNLPLNANETVVSNFATALQTNTTSFIAGYNVWVKTPDGFGNFVVAPGIGCILGAAYVYVPSLQNDFIHIPPAGIDSALTDIVEVYPLTIDQPTLNLYTRDYTVNSVVFRQRLGYFVMTSRTYSTNALYQSIHIRLQTSFYVKVLESNMGFAIQRPNTPSLKRDIYSVLYAFFKQEYNNGALEQSVDFKTACEIICDQSNNPVTQPRTDLNADVNWIPTETTEGIKIRLNRNDGVLLVSTVA